MKKILFLWVFVLVLMNPLDIRASDGQSDILESAQNTTEEQKVSGDENDVIEEIDESEADSYTRDYIEKMLDEIGSSNLDQYIPDSFSDKMKFSDLVSSLALDSKNDILKNIGNYVYSSFFYEFEIVREILIQIMCFAAVFAIFNKGIISTRGYVYDMSFFMIYCAMMLLLIQSFGLIGQEVQKGMEQMITFLSALIPAYTAALVFSGNVSSAASFYSFTLALVYIIQWMLKIVIFPMINMYMLIQLLDNVFAERKLSRLAELIEEVVKVLLRVSIAFVIGAQVIQSFIAPAKDRIAESFILKSVNAIPGIGNVTGAAAEVIYSCGILVKNSIGAAGLITLSIIMLYPIIKVLVFLIGYRLLAAILQPVSDVRIVDSIHDVSRGIGLYLSLLLSSSVLFFITISMACASTSFIM